MSRAAGILMPITSLPGNYGIGCFSKEAYAFIDWLRDAGQTFWQILPIHPTSYGDSPYQSFSTFAGNPYFIDLEMLIDEGVLTREECDSVDFGDDDSDIDYEEMYSSRYILLTMAYERSNISQDPEYRKFVEENRWWLDDYALFMALKNFFGGQCWYEWPQDIRLRWGFALDYYRRELYFEIEFQQYLQYTFFRQWRKLKAYANARNIKIIGDIPIYVAQDGVDRWTHAELFQVDEQNNLSAVAGCPPDAFSADGQIWGNPLYRWDYHRATGFDWWIQRLRHTFRLYDAVRLDHFRGFDEYFSVPFGAKSALTGHWEKGPGMDLFHTIRYHLGEKELIVEDLGLMTDSVRRLVRDSGFPNMKVLQFAFDKDDVGAANDYLPHNYDRNCVVYTGTHDNETIAGWLDGLDAAGKKQVRDYICDHDTPDDKLYWRVIVEAMKSSANTCIIPVQDYLGLGNEARMNQPSTLSSNWSWRLMPNQIPEEVTQEMLAVTKRYGRANWDALKAEEEAETEE